MAKISAEERLRKQNELNEIVLDIFWNQGWSYVTYAEVAKRFGTTKSAIQRYYPSQKHFGDVMAGKVLPVLMEQLDWSSESAFIDSWVSALSNESDLRFRRIIELLFGEINDRTPSEPTVAGVERFKQKVTDAFGNDKVIYEIFGRSFYFLLQSR